MTNTKITLKLNRESQALLDAATKSGSVSKLTVKMEASHSGIINKNGWFYTPVGMKDGAGSFVSPYNKPVLVNHNQQSDALGRVIASEYEAYPSAAQVDLGDTLDSVSVRNKIIDYTHSEAFLADGHKGLGHLILTVEITDADAIERLLDGRYLTVSISGDTEQAVCSTCGQDRKNLADDDEYCNHYRGEVYDGERSFLIAGAMTFREVSFVNSPADEHANVVAIADGIAISDSMASQELEIIDFVVDKDTTGDRQLKRKLSELLKDSSLQTVLDKALTDLGLSNGIQTADELKDLRKTDFLYADQRLFPIHSDAAIVAAYKVFENVEDSKDKAEVMAVLDKRYKRAFKDATLASTITDLQSKTADGQAAPTEPAISQVADFDYDKVATLVSKKMQATFDVGDSFLASRNSALEEELTLLEDENTALSKSLRANIVLQILQIEDKSDDAGHADDLASRSLDSLQDKLGDLIKSQKADGNGTDDKIEDPNVSLDDAEGVEGVGDANAADSSVPNGTPLTIGQVRTEYRSIMKSKGMRAASAYIADLRKNETLPEHFAFTG